MRFELIDQIVHHDATSLTAIKAVTRAEEYLGDHFPGFEVLPGVMMLECLAQAGRALADRLDDPPQRPLMIQSVRNVKYANMVKPGDTLTLSVTLKNRDGHTYDLLGVGRVGEAQPAVQGRLILSAMPDPTNPLALNGTTSRRPQPA